jgi:shikimate kinase
MMIRNHLVYIIGFMGSGKTTAGKKLASALEWSFVDLDKKIEEHTGKLIPDLFSQYSEDYFRVVEAEVLRTLKDQTNIVISTGGGTPCQYENMDYMLETGVTIYLKLTPGQLKSRLTGSKSVRPLIKDLDPADLLGFIENKLSLREKWYSRAEMTVEGIDTNIDLILSLVKEKLNI